MVDIFTIIFRVLDIIFNLNISNNKGGARGVMIIVVGNGHGDTRSNTGRDWLYFT